MMAGQNRAILWAWYGLTTATAMVAGYLFVMLDSRSSPGIVPMLWQFVATIVLYPFAQRLIDLFEDADVRFR
jgi:rod shape-determining protein MreD